MMWNCERHHDKNDSFWFSNFSSRPMQLHTLLSDSQGFDSALMISGPEKYEDGAGS